MIDDDVDDVDDDDDVMIECALLFWRAGEELCRCGWSFFHFEGQGARIDWYGLYVRGV